jgi:hypothetical protein
VPHLKITSDATSHVGKIPEHSSIVVALRPAVAIVDQQFLLAVAVHSICVMLNKLNKETLKIKQVYIQVQCTQSGTSCMELVEATRVQVIYE